MFSIANLFGFGWQSDGVFRSWGGSVVNFSATATDRHTVDKAATYCMLDGSVLATTANGAITTNTLPLFANCSSGTITQYTCAKMYSCQIYDNDILVRDYAPAMNSDGIAGLYDKVNDVFYPSASSTAFVAGDEVAVVEETIATQTTATGAYKIPVGVEYTVSASDIVGYTTPANQSYTASQQKRSVTVSYEEIELGVFIQDIYGNLYDEDEWDGTQPINGVAVLTDDCQFILGGYSTSNGYAWLSYGTLLEGVATTTVKSEALSDFNGRQNSENMIPMAEDGTTGVLAAVQGYIFPNGSIGYVGSLGEWAAVMNNLEKIESLYDFLGWQRISYKNIYYWSSTQYSGYNAWNVYVSPDRTYSYGYSAKGSTLYPLSFAPYIESPEWITFYVKLDNTDTTLEYKCLKGATWKQFVNSKLHSSSVYTYWMIDSRGYVGLGIDTVVYFYIISDVGEDVVIEEGKTYVGYP